MPHAGELLSVLGTLRGEGDVVKRDNSLIVLTGGLVLLDELGNVLMDEASQELTE